MLRASRHQQKGLKNGVSRYLEPDRRMNGSPRWSFHRGPPAAIAEASPKLPKQLSRPTNRNALQSAGVGTRNTHYT
jgi:hypothetical protein